MKKEIKISILLKNIKKIYNSGGLHIIIGSFASKFVMFFGTIFLVNTLSKSEYGQLTYLENLYGYIYLIAGFGLSNSLLRYIIKAKNIINKKTIYHFVIRQSLIINLCLVVFFSLLTFFVPFAISFENIIFYSITLVVIIPFQYLLEINNLTFRGLFKNKSYSITILVFVSLLVTFRILGAYYFGLKGAIFAKLLIYVLYSIILTFYICSLFNKETNEMTDISSKLKKEMYSYSFQYMVTNGIWMIFMLNDIFLLGLILGNVDIVADFKVAYSLPANMSIIAVSIGILVGPYFVLNELDNKWVWKNYKKLIFSVMALVLPVAIILFAFSPIILDIFFGDEYVSRSNLMRIITIGAFVNATVRYPSAHILSSMGKVKYNLVISVIGIIVQVILNVILINNIGILGPAYTSIIVYVLMSIALVITIKKIYGS